MALVNYLGTYDALDQVWETFPEGGKEGDYLYVAGTLKKWDKYTSAWIDPSDEDLAESTIVTSEEDVIVGSSTLINYLGRFEVLEDALNAYPEGGNEGDYLYVGDAIYAWDKYANEWVVSNDTPISVVMTDDEIIPNSTRFINYLGGFVDRATVWQKYPEGGNEGDYIYIAGELHIWDKYINNWVAAEPPAESSQIRPIEYLAQDGVVEYSENYINYLGVFDTIEQAWEVYPEGGKEGDYIIVGGEQLRWNKYTSNWGEYDPDASTPARPMATVFGDLHVFNDVIIGEELRARILETFTTKKWILEQKYISLEAITSDVVMSKIAVDGKTIVIQNGKLVARVEDKTTWGNLEGKPDWIKDTPPTLDEIVGSSGDGFVTLLGEQKIEGVKNFVSGAKFNEALLTYDTEKKAWIFPGNILATGGITAHASLEGFDIPTIMDAIVIDDTLSKEGGVLRVVKAGLDEDALLKILSREGYVQGDWVREYSTDALKLYALKTEIPDTSDFVDKSTYQEISAIKNFQKGVKINGSPVFTYNPITQSFVLNGNLIVTGGGAFRAALGDLDVPTIMDALIVDNQKLIIDNGVLTLNPNLDLGGIDKEELETYLEPYAKSSYIADTYATIASLSAVTTRLDEFLAGSDTDTIINKWKELETFLSGLSESDDLATLLAGKADTAYIDNTFVKLATVQSITARHDFADGFKVGGLPIYKSQDDVIYIDANVVVRGGMTARGTNGTTAPSIYAGLPIDGTSIYWDNGILKSSATSSGGIDEAFLEDYLFENKYATQDWVTGKGYLMKTGDVLTLKADQYSGSYALNLQNSNIVNVNAVFTSDLAESAAEGIQFKRSNGNFDSIWVADGVMYFSPNGNNAEMTGSYTTNYTVLHSGNYSSYPVRNPNALSWSGYSSGSYDGSAAKSIALPTKLSQLADDVVSGKYLPITGGTVNGAVTINHSGNTPLVINQTYATNNSRGVVLMNSSMVNGHMYYSHLFGKAASSKNSAYVGFYHASAGSDSNYLSMGLYGVNNVLNITAVGNVGIGTTAPSEKLHVYGNLIATGGITARYTSDMRLKQNRRSFKAGEVLMSLGAVQQFEYIPSEVAKNKIYEGTHIGLIYQNVIGTALNRMCHEREDGYGSLNYLEPSFISLLAGVGQEHETRIQQLERENKALKKKVEQLERRVA